MQFHHRRAGAAPVDLGQRGVVLRCLEALTGDGQLLVRKSTLLLDPCHALHLQFWRLALTPRHVHAALCRLRIPTLTHQLHTPAL